MSDQSLTMFIKRLEEGDRTAAAPIWNHFYSRLIRLASARLKPSVRRVVEGEDVVQSVFESCFRRLENRQFPDIRNRDNLWALLITMTERKASNANRHFFTQKAGGGNVSGESVFLSRSDSFSPGLDGIAGDEPTPEYAVFFADELEARMAMLPDDDARLVAQYMLEDEKPTRIADMTGFTVSKVRRKAELIRELWSRETDKA